jgi:hypothetical protein
MKTNSRRTIIGAAVIFISSIAFSGVLAEQSTAATTAGTATGTQGATQKKSSKEHPLKSLVEAYHAQVKSYLEQKRKEFHTFKESLKDKTPADQKPLIDQFRTQQISDIKTFITQQRSDLTSKIQSSSVPDNRKSEILAKLQERWTKIDAHMEKQMQENKQTLDQIFSDCVVSKEEKEMLKEQAKTQHKENKEFYNSQKSDHAKKTTSTTAAK